MFTSDILQEEAGVNKSNLTFRKTFYCIGYDYRRPRKKGMLTRHHKLKRFKFAKKVKGRLSHHDHGSVLLRLREISMYIDRVDHLHISNPYLHSKSSALERGDSKTRHQNLPQKLKKKVQVGLDVQVKFRVSVRNNAGVVLCEHLSSRINGKYYVSIVQACFR